MTTNRQSPVIPDDKHFARLEAELFDQIAEIDKAHTTPSRRDSDPAARTGRTRRWSVLAVAAAAVAATLVTVNLTAQPGVSAEAAELLQKASVSTIALSDLTIGAGKYLLVQTTHVSVMGDSSPDDGHQYKWLESAVDQLYVPADRNAEWTWIRPIERPVKTFGAKSEALARTMYDADIKRRPDGWVLRADAGAFYYTPSAVSPTALAQMPRDPKALLAYFRNLNRDSSRGDDAVFDSIVSLLVSGVVPADLRGALLETAALIPGIEIVDNSAVLDGRRGTAIGKASADGSSRTDLILDTTTGQVIGQRTVQLKESDGIPAGTEVESSAITLSVVDTVPDLPTSYLPKPG